MRRLALALAALPVLILMVAALSHLWHSRGSALPEREGAVLRVASFNTHYILLDRATGPWSVADWDRRKTATTRIMAGIDADIVAFQEMESFRRGDGSVNLARDHLLATLPAYAAGAVGDWRRFPSTQPIFFRRERFQLLDQGWFFFSDHPDVIYSRSFDGSFPAFASWVWLRDRRDGSALRVVNVHFDHASSQNRLKSAALVAERLTPWLDAGETLILAGDLNAIAGSRTAGILQAAGLVLMPARGASYHLNRGLNLFPAIDHVMIGPGLRYARRPVALRRAPGGVWPSDHYPIVADLLCD